MRVSSRLVVTEIWPNLLTWWTGQMSTMSQSQVREPYFQIFLVLFDIYLTLSDLHIVHVYEMPILDPYEGKSTFV